MASELLIIGGGIAGLATGCYGRMNGYRTRIFEMHSLPGGLCTAWKRKGYLVDGCIHWLCGSGPGPSLHEMWRELGPARELKFVDHPASVRLELPEMTFSMFTDLDVLTEYLCEIAPEDEAVILELLQGVRDYVRFMPILDAVMTGHPAAADEATLQEFSHFMEKANGSMGPFLERIRNPKLKTAFGILYNPYLPLLIFYLPLAYASLKSCGYPVGGSLEFARSIERRYLALGGEIEYEARVERILEEDGRAVGLLLADGREVRGEDVTVISTADLVGTTLRMLEGRHLPEEARAWFEQVPVIGAPLQVTVGVNQVIREDSTISGILFPPQKPLTLYGKPVGLVNLQVFSYDPTAAPEGKSVLRVYLEGNYDYWKTLHADQAAYEAEKARIAEAVIDVLDARYPGLAQAVEMTDVATPVTFERYTGNYRGSSQGWVPTPQANSGTAWFSSKTLPGLDRFYLAGQWVESFGGVPSAALSGRMVVERICQRDGKAFVTLAE